MGREILRLVPGSTNVSASANVTSVSREIRIQPQTLNSPVIMGENPMTEDKRSWQELFKTPSKMEQRDVRFLVDKLIPPGITFIGGMPGDGKSWFALALAQAIFTGDPFLDHFKIPQKKTVIYLTPEVSESALKGRLTALGLGKVLDGFYVMSLTDGPAIQLTDPILLKAVRDLRPVVFLDTAIRFMNVKDENQSAEVSQGLANPCFQLIGLGAEAVIGLHHSRKRQKDETGYNLENTLRGAGDIAAMCDACYRVIGRDIENFIAEVRCVKARDFEPIDSFEIQGRPYIDATGKLHLLRPPEVDPEELERNRVRQVGEYIAHNPEATHRDIGKALQIRKADIPGLANQAGWMKVKGQPWKQVGPQAAAIQKVNQVLEKFEYGSQN
jgi:AAA domain